MKKLNLIRLVLFITLTACATYQPPARQPSSAPYVAPDYQVIFERARQYLIEQDGNKSLIKKVPESQFVQFLQENPEWINEEQSKLIAEVERVSKINTDPTKHTRLIPPFGKAGYEDVKVYVSHPYYKNGILRKKDSMVGAWINFIKKAKKEIILNVFDFDLEEVANALVAKAQKGVSVTVGIDKGVHDARPEVQKVSQILTAGGVRVVHVRSVGLNHQKVTSIDWSDPELASVLFSSGNLTRSCIEPDGDLKGIVPLPAVSVPNANHLITMKSFILANLIKHELTKTLDDKFLLRGKQYPINGSYQVTGPGVDPQVLEAYPEPSIIITFAPNGGLKNINKNLIAHILRKETGSIRMIQFAFSSTDVEETLLFRAQQDIQATGKFDFMSVGDTPFAMRDWSRFLIMSGMKLEITPMSKKYLDDKEGTWWTGIGEEQINNLRKNIYAAPKVYADNYVLVDKAKLKANAKIHHKILATPNFAIVGTSFNFSQGAESNNEQMLIFKDKSMSKLVDGMLKYLVKNSRGTVYSEAQRRNLLKVSIDEESDGVEDQAGQ
jgi:phosphatidylserine/phosphatidylglycerophosphate/cardiolipin synthase-like enzyme